MSTLLLDERPPVFTLSKITNTFSARHHLRAFDPSMQIPRRDGVDGFFDAGHRHRLFPDAKTFIHFIDQYIDSERAKVMNDLLFTGCVDAAELVPRPWVPLDAYNATGDRLRTDGAAAVLRINECRNPKTIGTEYPKAPPLFQAQCAKYDVSATQQRLAWQRGLSRRDRSAKIAWLDEHAK